MGWHKVESYNVNLDPSLLGVMYLELVGVPDALPDTVLKPYRPVDELWSATLDVLRNEGPVNAFLNDAGEITGLSTGREPTGEGE